MVEVLIQTNVFTKGNSIYDDFITNKYPSTLHIALVNNEIIEFLGISESHSFLP